MPQPKFDRFHLDRLRSSFLPALLIVALAVTATVTWHAYRASREHRAVVERVMTAYVSFVAQRVQEATQQAINSCAEYWLYPVRTSAEPAPSQIQIGDGCGATDGGRFQIELNSKRAVSYTGVDQRLISWLADTLQSHPATPVADEWQIGSIIAVIDNQSQLISYAAKLQNGKVVTAIGLVARGALEYITANALQRVQLPSPMAAAGRTPDYFSVEYIAGNSLVRSGDTPTYYRQQVTSEPRFGGMRMVVGLKHAGLLQVAPGGIPRSRGLEFLALFALAAGLVASSLLLLRREAELARTRANFVSGVSHELRTPLAQIRMFAEMLLLGRVRSEADRRRSLEIIDTEARRLSQLVDNVLQVARSENGHVHVNPTNMPLAPIVRECVESFSVLAQARGMDFRMELQEELVAPVDSAALRQIVLNLLDNAAKYGPDGQRVVVGVALVDDSARLWIDDEGPGIPPRERERVFDAFYRSREQQNTTGSGIGLSVVRELVVLHGGTAWIEAAPEAGTRVVVQLPGAYLAAQQKTAGDVAVA